MKTTQKAYRKFYQNIGKLFYAIAAADKIVRNEELNALKTIVKAEWLANNNFDTEIEIIIIDTFEWLHNDNEHDSETCFNSFMDYKNANEHEFTAQIKGLILKTAGKIASSFSGENKSELIMLANLSIEFKKPFDEK